jgi:glycosyltransferase involved in cell wall biosynthesis
MITFISHQDWANVGYEFAKAMKSIFVDAEAYTFELHPFDYPKQAILIKDVAHLKEILDKTDVIVYMHSLYVDNILGKKYKKQMVFHGGSIYRQNAAIINKFYNQFVDATLIQTRDLWDLGAEKKHWIQLPIDTSFPPKFENVGVNKLVFGHFPSSKIKGTEKIKEVIARFGDTIDFLCGDCEKRTSHDINMDNLSKCDVVIDSLYPEEVKCGCWGRQTLEAASLGKIVIANDVCKHIYAQEYGYSPLLVANNEQDLREQVAYVLSLSPDEVLELKKLHRIWAETIHSYENIGKRILKVVDE